MYFKLVLIAVLLEILGHAHNVSAAQPKYSLIIDSGSSGTRIYAYRWQPSVQPGGGMPIVQVVKPSEAKNKIPRRVKAGMYERVETQPGLSAFVDDSKGLRSIALSPLLDWAKAVVPARQWRCTPIFLLATAGVRKLEPQHKSRLMTEVQAVLSQSGFRFKPQWARIITGAEEGAFGWVAANYQAGLLNAKPLPAAAPAIASNQPGSSSASSFDNRHLVQGTLDLGGSSLEITLLDEASIVTDLTKDTAPSDLDINDGSMAVNGTSSSQVTVLVVGPMKFKLKTQTFKHFGLSDTFDRSVTLLLQDALTGAPDMQPPTTAAKIPSVSSKELVTEANRGLQIDAQAKSSGNTAGLTSTLSYTDGSVMFEQPLARGIPAPAPSQQSEDAMAKEALQQAKEAEIKSLLATAQMISQQSSPATSSAVSAPMQMQARRLADTTSPPNLKPDVQGTTKVALPGQTQEGKPSMAAQSNVTIVEHPCLHKGYRAQYNRIHNFNKFIETMEVMLVGTSNLPACQRLAKRLVAESLAACHPSSGSSTTTGIAAGAISDLHDLTDTAGISRPPSTSVGKGQLAENPVAAADCSSPAAGLPQLRPGLHGLITALTGFFVVWRFFLGGAVTASKPADAEMLLPAVHEMCNKPWSQISAELGHHINVEKYCLWGHYAVDLLGHEGLDLLPTTSTPVSKPAVTIGPGDIGWSLGAALSEVSRASPDVFAAKAGNTAGGWLTAFSRQSCEETSISVASAVNHDSRHRMSILMPLALMSSVVLLVVYVGWSMFRRHQQRHHQAYRPPKPSRLGSMPPLLPVSMPGTGRGTRRTPSYLSLGPVTSED